ncbi:MAG: hypothetical protein R2807_07800 [Chitinophagales bacterium]
MRALGGTLYLTGVILMAYNLIKTVRKGSFVEREEAEAAPLAKNIYTPEKHSGIVLSNVNQLYC